MGEVGVFAVEQAKILLQQSRSFPERIRDFARSRLTVRLGSCAPAPLWELRVLFEQAYPALVLEENIAGEGQLLDEFDKGVLDLLITTNPAAFGALECISLGVENLAVAVDLSHPVASMETVFLRELDGMTMLLAANLGYWDDLVVREMPRAHFLVQHRFGDFQELLKASSLPAFVTTRSLRFLQQQHDLGNRVRVPIADADANPEYWLAARPQVWARVSRFIAAVQERYAEGEPESVAAENS